MTLLQYGLRKKQQGAAVIMFLLMIPALMGFMTLGIEGGRYLRLKANVADVAEVAGLAIIATDSFELSDADKIDEQLKDAESLALKYINSLVPEAGSVSVSIERKRCGVNDECLSLAGENTSDISYLQYQLNVQTIHKSLLPVLGEGGVGFTTNVDLGSFAVTRKYSRSSEGIDSLDEPVDVIFVADFSGSMDCPWGIEYCSRPQVDSKIDMLKEVVNDISDFLYEESKDNEIKNNVALVPFNGFTYQRKANGDLWSMRQIHHFSNPQSTIDRMFQVKGPLEDPAYLRGDAYFYTVALTSDVPYLKQSLDEMLPGWGTVSYDGIIRGAQIALEGTNRRRLIIVPSDGMDSGVNGERELGHNASIYHGQLNDLGYCDTIRSEIDSQMVDEEPVTSEIAGSFTG